MTEMEKCRFLPMRYTTTDEWDRDGDCFYTGCVFDEPFGDIPAGEYRSVFVSVDMGDVYATTADDRTYETEFKLVPKE